MFRFRIVARNFAAKGKVEEKTKQILTGTLLLDADVAPPTSRIPAGTVLKGLCFTVGETDPVIKEDSEYPTWIFDCLKPKEALEPLSKQAIKKANVNNIKVHNRASAEQR